jgi:hypothetical protein
MITKDDTKLTNTSVKAIRTMSVKESRVTRPAVKEESTANKQSKINMDELSKKGYEIYKKMHSRIKKMKEDDPLEKEKLEKKKLDDENKKKMEERRKERLNLLLEKSQNIITTKLDNGDILMFSGDNMDNALKTSFRFSHLNNVWEEVDNDEKLPKIPTSRREMNNMLMKIKKETIEHTKKEMEYDFTIMLSLLQDSKNDEVEKIPEKETKSKRVFNSIKEALESLSLDNQNFINSLSTEDQKLTYLKTMNIYISEK